MTRREWMAGALALAGTQRTVDAHVHVWTHDPRYPWARPAPAREANAEMLLDLMRAAGVERTVIVQYVGYLWDNRYAADVLKRYPGRFCGVARVNPEDPAAPDHLSRLTGQGFQGVRLNPAGNASGDWIRGPLMPPLWARCRDLRVPMTILAPITRMPEIGRLADRFPDLTIVIDHMADCPVDQPAKLEKLLALRRYPRVFVKVSHTWSLSRQPYPYLDAQEMVKRVYQAFGARRLMAGSDWPLSEKSCSYSQVIDLARKQWHFLNDEDRSWITGRTAEQVWHFGSRSGQAVARE